MKEKILLISGCSNAAGSEIDGTQDSVYNRQHSFGNLLAAKLDRRPINIASGGSTNQGIARTVLEWMREYYNSDTMDLMVLLAWTESTRMELPVDRITWHEQWNEASDFISPVSRNYLRVNLGYKGADPQESSWIAQCHEFIMHHERYIEIISANTVLQMEYFLKHKGIDYIMCNTMHMFSDNPHIKFYIDQIDQGRYYNMLDNDKGFYWKYRNLGYINPKTEYWHHSEEPHRLYAEELYKFHTDK